MLPCDSFKACMYRDMAGHKPIFKIMNKVHLVLFIDYVAKNDGERVNYNYVLRAAKGNTLPDYIDSRIITLNRHSELIRHCKEQALQHFSIEDKQVHTFTTIDFNLSLNF